jgi:hypothetical protein
MSRALLSNHPRSPNVAKKSPFDIFRAVIRPEEYHPNLLSVGMFTKLLSESKNFFTEMTEKMVHVCENYDNWFINKSTANKRVVFVEF